MCFDCFLSDTPAFKRLQPWPEAVGILARGRASPGQMPWESSAEAVRVLARGRARGIFPGPNPSEPQVGVLARGGVRGKILIAGLC